MKKSTLEEFILKAREVHGDKYDYSKTIYVNSTAPITITCPMHGDFKTRPSDHIHKKCGCRLCGGTQPSNTEEFLEKAKGVHGDKYDYSKVLYNGNKKKVCIICHKKNILGEEHGEFWQRPNDHLTGYACPKCGNNYVPTTEEWVAHAKIVHDNKYDYSKTKYVNATTKVCVICPIHGEFLQNPNNHLNGAGCPNCNNDNKSKMEENIHQLLLEHNITHERQKTFPWLKFKRNLFLDFYIPYKKIAIEVQGEQHFTPVNRFGGMEYYLLQQERDKEKRILCEKHGIKLFYITKRNYNLNEVLDYLKK